MGSIILCLACVMAGGAPGQLHVLEGAAPLSDGSILVFRGAGFRLAIGPAPEGSLVIDPEAGAPEDYAAVAEGFLRSSLTAADYGEVLYRRDGVSFVRLDPERTAGFTEATVRLRPLVDREMHPELPEVLAFDPYVEQIVAAVSEDSLISIIGRLEGFQSRFWSSDSFPAARDWAIARLESMGYEVEVQEFPVGTSGVSQNLIVTIPGTVYPDRYWLIGAHLDSGEDGFGIYPGADDNASGSAAVLEAARTMRPYQFEYTVKMALWGAEEPDLVGSEYYAAQAAAAGDSIMCYMNLDMILYAYEIGPIVFDEIRVAYTEASEPMMELYDQISDMYVGDLDKTFFDWVSGSGDTSFFYCGFTTLGLVESMSAENPYYHEPTDLIANYLECFPFGTNVAKSGVAFIAALAVPVGLGIGGEQPEPVTVGVSPSPAGSIAFVEASGIGEAPATVDLYDLSGRLVESVPLEPDGTVGLDMSALQPGVYLIRVTADGGCAGTARLVVCR